MVESMFEPLAISLLVPLGSVLLLTLLSHYAISQAVGYTSLSK